MVGEFIPFTLCFINIGLQGIHVKLKAIHKYFSVALLRKIKSFEFLISNHAWLNLLFFTKVVPLNNPYLTFPLHFIIVVTIRYRKRFYDVKRVYDQNWNQKLHGFILINFSKIS